MARHPNNKTMIVCVNIIVLVFRHINYDKKSSDFRMFFTTSLHET